MKPTFEPNFSRGILFEMIGCSVTQPYVTNISPAGEQGILVEKCKEQFNSLTEKVSTEQCNTSYVWLGAASMGKVKSEEGAIRITMSSLLIS